MIARGAPRIHNAHALARSPVTSRKNIKLDTALLKLPAEINDEGSLTRPADRNISHADDRCAQSRAEHSRVVDEISRPYHRAVKNRERVHCAATNRIKASTVRAVAPRCDSSTARAFSPMVRRLDSSTNSS